MILKRAHRADNIHHNRLRFRQLWAV